jgi:hypothetical protein
MPRVGQAIRRFHAWIFEFRYLVFDQGGRWYRIGGRFAKATCWVAAIATVVIAYVSALSVLVALALGAAIAESLTGSQPWSEAEFVGLALYGILIWWAMLLPGAFLVLGTAKRLAAEWRRREAGIDRRYQLFALVLLLVAWFVTGLTESAEGTVLTVAQVGVLFLWPVSLGALVPALIAFAPSVRRALARGTGSNPTNVEPP